MEKTTFLDVQPQLVRNKTLLLCYTLTWTDQKNPAYLSIQKETLSAVAPFLDLAKKRGRAASTTSSSPTKPGSYAYGGTGSPDKIEEAIVSPVGAHKHKASASTLSLDELRHGSTPLTSVRSNGRTADKQLGELGPGSSPSSIFSSSQGSPDSSPEASKSCPSSTASGTRVSLSNSNDKYAPSSQASALAFTYAVNSPPPQLELMQNRISSMSLSPQSPQKLSASTLVPVITPDPAFLLTKFVHDSVRLYSPSKQEHDEKKRLQLELESILQVIQPTASLVVFGSVKNGLALANADLDLMVVDRTKLEDQLHDLRVDLPCLYAEALRTQGFVVKLLTKTRIPLIKISQEYVAGAFSVDISFDNPLALHNTRLMATYNDCDPRFGVLVMFIKLWARARRINDAFAGTLKSYGFMIMLIYYLQNKASPALLPNLQMISPSGRAVSADELECQGFDIWYAKDVGRMHAIQQNSQSVGELLEGFFSHFAYEFDYRDASWVVSINVFGGLQTKESKRWTQLVEHMNESGSARVKDRFILCVSDPFEISHNVARTVTRAGLYEIRGSMMAAVRAIRGNKLTDLLLPNL